MFWQTLRVSDVSQIVDRHRVEPLQLELLSGKMLSVMQEEAVVARTASDLCSLVASFEEAATLDYLPSSDTLVTEVKGLKLVMDAVNDGDSGGGAAGKWIIDDMACFLNTSSAVRKALQS